MTRSSASRLLLLVLLALMASGCAVVGGIFKAGVWVGAIVAILIIVVVLFIVGKARG
ncbi:MAG: phosphatidate cytidylyltransferase [Acidobacteriota bacterium]